MSKGTDLLLGALRRGFPDVEAETLHGLLETAQRQSYPAGAVLCHQGEVEDVFYVILEGAVDVSQTLEDGQERFLETLEAGRYFGEMALLDDRPRFATVMTREPTEVLEITRQGFDALVDSNPAIASAITRRLLEILRTHEDSLVEALVAREAAAREMAIGRRIQESFLPRALPQLEGYEIAGHFQAARQVAGDFYDVFELDAGRRLGLIIADVCDKGVGAALFMALFRSLLRAFAEEVRTAGAGETALKDVIVRTNDYIARHHGHTHMFATIFFGVLDPASGELTYINGGHEPPLILAGERIKAELAPTGPAVGLFAGMPFEVAQARLEAGDCLVGFTDGVTEARNQEGAFYGEERLRDLLAATQSGAAALLAEIVESVRSFTAGAPQSDDITLFAVRHLTPKYRARKASHAAGP